MRRKYFSGISVAILVFFSGQVFAQDSAVFDSQSNTWKLYYQDPETSVWVNKTYVQQNAIKPSIKSVVQPHDGQYEYRYRVMNRRDAKQEIDTFRIWGIPLVYAVPNFPLVTANAKIDPEAEDKQRWAQLKAKSTFERSVVKAPNGWSAGLRVDEKVGHTSFVWTPGLKERDPDGIPPGRKQDGFVVYRPELPGVARAKLTGSTAEPWGLDDLPETPFWTAKIEEIQDRDYVLVPVLAPIISVPDPYNGAELARRIKNHVQTWVKYGHVNADVLVRLNRQFDVLVPALELNNKQGARAAMQAIRKELADRHPGLDDARIEEDDDAFDAPALIRNHGREAAAGAPSPVDRVAARALAFDLRYLLRRMDSGK